MPRKKKPVRCPLCWDGGGEYFVIVNQAGTPTLEKKECPIDGKKQKPVPVERVHPVLFAGEPT